MLETGLQWPASPAAALELLLEGNKRFISGNRLHPHQDADRRTALAPAQRPFAVLFGCSDSRLAAEIIFDRGLGDLFVVRTAGHVVGAEVLGSIEYAVAALDTPLIAVLGHDSCGAIAATLAAIERGITPAGFMRDVVERVMLSVLPVREQAITNPDIAVEEHVRYTVDMLAHRSAVIAERLADGRVGVVGLSYRLAEGSVRRVGAFGV
ncbi:carbonic anhydrase [Micromonospora sp. NBC_01796]|uniref:carbonic anhydrase n=1 Tax=Micromonospora sp. NBC_01796 TaxID=2975987 RepID=UPI002DD7E26A|nr:carbonic anhydrase [Micromonospora sp. NBC_01796]WSA84963.1 carbonic anhydrase [Micromonospora sp. NBC_01796]